jgi:diguanylate cyclase (GGDEF)-like protein/PAS domain S-box-containing protein
LDNFLSYVHPGDHNAVREAIKSVYKGKEYNIEYRIITPNGTERYVHEKNKTVYDENNNPIKIVGIIQDITNRKIIENSLNELDEHHNYAQKVAGVGSWKYDAVKDEFYGTEEMFNIYEIDPAEFIGNFNSTVELVHPDDRFKVKDALEKHFMGQSCDIEFRIPLKDGAIKYVKGKGEPIFDDNNRVVGIIGTLQDITETKNLEQELRKNNKILAQAQALAHIGSWEYDIVQNRLYQSEETYKIFGIKQEKGSIAYEELLKIIYPEDIEIIDKTLRNPQREPVDIEFRIVREDGSIRNIYLQVEHVFDKENDPVYIYGTTQDITEKKRLQQEIEQKQEEVKKVQKRFQVLVQNSSDVFEIISPDGTIKYISDAVEKIIGHKPEDRIGRKVYEFYEEEEQQKLKKMVALVLDDPGKKVQEDVILKANSGKEIYLEAEMQNLLHEPVIEGIVINFRDITRRIEMEKRLVYISVHDELTGIPNRNYFQQKIEQKFRNDINKDNRCAILMLEVDGLKYINDALGYHMGDRLIKAVTSKLQRFLGDSIFISRYSGVVFAIIIDDKEMISGSEKLAEDLITLFTEPIKVANFELSVGINIGISIYKDIEQDGDMLVNQAEIALFWSKKEGKNKYKFYSSDINIQNYKQFQLRNTLRKALKNNQFKVYYQPLINLKTNEILAAEALIRWDHPEWGMLSPGEFIPLAEETGFIIDVGNWVLEEVCKNYKDWLGKELPKIKLSVNFSAIQFLQNKFVENVIKIINKFELDPHFLIMEITESILVEKSDKAISDIKRLQSFGIQIALDDFGTGFSSLASLNTFKIDIVKIDGSFVRKIPADNTSTAITKSIVNLTKELNKKLVVEGIETWEQLSYLRDLKCYAGQGYIYSKPIPSKDFEKVLAKRKCKPVIISNAIPREDRRKFFRVNFPHLLEADMTILRVKGKKIRVGNTKVLIKNMGPGGLCFISDMKLPVDREFIIQFSAELLEQELKVYGYPAWTSELEDDFYEYGVEFTIDENKRTELTGVLNLAQIKIRNNILFAEGSFVSSSYRAYFGKEEHKSDSIESQ